MFPNLWLAGNHILTALCEVVLITGVYFIVCLCVHIWSLKVKRTWMPITDCFIEPALVFKRHEHLMTSLFLLLENLFQSLFRLLVIERKQEKHPVVLADYQVTTGNSSWGDKHRQCLFSPYSNSHCYLFLLGFFLMKHFDKDSGRQGFYSSSS